MAPKVLSLIGLYLRYQSPVSFCSNAATRCINIGRRRGVGSCRLCAGRPIEWRLSMTGYRFDSIDRIFLNDMDHSEEKPRPSMQTHCRANLVERRSGRQLRYGEKVVLKRN